MSPNCSSQPPATSGTYQHWTAARDRLSQTIKEYVNACSALESTFSHSGSLLVAHQDILRQIALKFDTHLPTLADEEFALQGAHAALLSSRNSMKLASPINRLPIELLTNVLSMASQAHAPADDISSEGQVSPTVLASVCHSWRQLLLTSPSFWSHLDFTIDIPYISNAQLHRLELWSERSRDASISLGIKIRVHLDHRSSYLELNDEHGIPTRTIVSTLAKALAPIATRVCYVKIELLELVSAAFLQALLGCVTVTCGTKHIDTLSLRSDSDDLYRSGEPLEVFLWDEKAMHNSGYCTESDIGELLNSISVPDLNYIAFPRDIMAPTKLRELSHSETLADLRDILAVLKSNPCLQSLSLVRVCIIKDITPEPVHLPQLQYLELLPERLFELGLVLSLLVPGDLPLDVHIEIEKDEYRTSDPTVAFFRRSNIFTLHTVGSGGRKTWFAPLSSDLPHLTQLTLEHCNFDDPV
ncbi:hypothetical protein FRC08_000269 [Ceratobasidium sp. 394]|nr:hypothetical protein FRC08_000269 [Ceratobasidium sp. 394]